MKQQIVSWHVDDDGPNVVVSQLALPDGRSHKLSATTG